MGRIPCSDAGQGLISRSDLDNQINDNVGLCAESLLKLSADTHGIVYLIIKVTSAYQALASISCRGFRCINLVAHINKVNRVSSITEFKVSAGQVGHRCYRANKAPINQIYP